MFGVRELNVAIELWGVAFCLIGAVSIMLFAHAVGRSRYLLVTMFVSALLCAGADALAGLYRGAAGDVAWLATHVGNFVTFASAFVLAALFVQYLCVRLEESSGKTYYLWSKVVAGLAVVMVVCTLGGLFYSIDEGNVYARSPWYWISSAYAVLVGVVSVVLVIRERRSLGAGSIACLLFYSIAPVFATAIQAFIYGPNLMIVATVLGLVVLFMETQVQTARATVEQAEALARTQVEVSESRLALLTSQIQPHFLFNTLDTIYGLCDENMDQAKRAIASFSHLLRMNLASLKHNEPVPIETEIDYVDTYLDLEQMSDESRLKYEFDVQAAGFRVPALSVRTLVENAVKHGLGERSQGGTLVVRTRELPHEYLVSVIDDGVGFDTQQDFDESQHTGLSNTRDRLEAMCGGTLEVLSEPGKGTTAIMHIPKKEAK